MNNNITKQKAVIGIDLGDKKHAVCALDQDGNILNEYFIYNRTDDLEQICKDYPKARVAMEVGSHSPWISRLLEASGMEVFVANARKLRAIYTNDRKSDELDARMLAKIARLDTDLLHPVRHRSEQNQRDLIPIKLRDTLVKQRTQLAISIRCTLKSLGITPPSCDTYCFAKKGRAYLEQNHPDLLPLLEPGLCGLKELNTQIYKLDRMIIKISEELHPETKLLQQIPGVGPVTALSFVLSIDKDQFPKPRDVGAYLGLVPRRDQSGNTDKQLPITKAGNRYLRSLLVQCAQYILGHFGPDCDLRRQGLKLAAKGGKAAKRKAVVATARKLSVVLLVLWQNESEYQPLKGQTQEAA